MATRFVVNDPNPERIITSLRSSGYKLRGAIADLIDNSISAGADLIEIEAGLSPTNEVFFSIGDDGHGIDEQGMVNAMQYGSPPSTDTKSLGKFGLGLKTSSSGFCRRFSLISRAESNKPISKATWDLDHVADKGAWELELSDPESYDVQLLEQTAGKKAGTLLRWEKIDSMIDLVDTDGVLSKQSTINNRMNRALENVRMHLGMVFQRYLDEADPRVRTVTIRVNGEDISPWDPFATHEPETEAIQTTQSVTFHDGKKSFFSLTAHILPRPEAFSSETARKLYQIGINTRATALQGIYVYRENRMIAGPDWLGIWQQEVHNSLLRVDLSFDHTMDKTFEVDFKKSSINLKHEITNFIEQKLAPIRREAEKTHRAGKRRSASVSNPHTTSANVIQQQTVAGTLVGPTITSINTETSQVNIQNNAGSVQLGMRIDVQPDQMHLSRYDTLEDGVLWQPGIVNHQMGVLLNTGHPYYQKTWQAYRDDTIIIQALDYLVWALCQAENNNTVPDYVDMFQQFRIEVSRNLKKLVENLPDPE